MKKKILKMLEELSKHCKYNRDCLWEDDLEDKPSCIRDDGQVGSRIQNIIDKINNDQEKGE